MQRRLSERGHENVIRYIGIKTDLEAKEFQIFLEYADGGEIFDQIGQFLLSESNRYTQFLLSEYNRYILLTYLLCVYSIFRARCGSSS